MLGLATFMAAGPMGDVVQLFREAFGRYGAAGCRFCALSILTLASILLAINQGHQHLSLHIYISNTIKSLLYSDIKCS